MAEHVLRILHLSDLHEWVLTDDVKPEHGGKRRAGAATKYRVFEGSLCNVLGEIAEKQKIDLVCFTGDVAYHGAPAEYKQATDRMNRLLARAKVGPERLFVVPAIMMCNGT